jgi:hypothetical protein
MCDVTSTAVFCSESTYYYYYYFAVYVFSAVCVS